MDEKEKDEVQEEEVEETEETTEEEKDVVKTIKEYVKAEVDLNIAKAKSEIDKDVEAWKEEQKALFEKKAGVHAEGVQEKRAKINTYIRDLSQAVLSGDHGKVKELTTGDAGADVVDSELSAEIRHLQTEYGVARREFFTTQLSKNSYEANALVTDVSVGWVDEGAVISTVSVDLSQTELKLKKLAAIAAMSRELLQDQEVDLFSFIAGRVAEGFAKAEDEAFFKGDGTSTYGGFTGLLQNTDVEEVSGSISVANIYSMIDTLPQGAHANAKFYANRTQLSVIRQLKDDSGQYIYQNPLAVGSTPTLAGYPLVLVEAMPKASDSDNEIMLFGDLRRASILGYRAGIAVDRSNSAVVRNQDNDGDVNTFTTDREAIRWVTRVGAITILPSAVVKLVTSES